MALPVVIACITTAIGVSVLVGRMFGLSKPLRLLLAAGTSVCGCTAICAMTPVVRARAVDSGLAVTCVVVLGCTGMLSTRGSRIRCSMATRIWQRCSSALRFMTPSQVMGASMIYAQQFNAADAVAMAGFTKLLRNLSLLILVPLAVMLGRNGEAKDSPSEA